MTQHLVSVRLPVMWLSELCKGRRPEDIKNALPPDAQLLGCYYEHQTASVVMIFSHSSFLSVEDGGAIPNEYPLIRFMFPEE